MDENVGQQELTVHLNYGDEGKTVSVKLDDLEDDQLQELYDSGLEEARFVLRERTGWDPAVNILNMTKEDFQWRLDWKKRHGATAGGSE